MERPIIFNGEMVRAILDNRKRATRRLNGLHEINKNPDQWTLQSFEKDPELCAYDKNGNLYSKVMKGLIATFENTEYGEAYRNIKCLWQVGDTLWVKETWVVGDVGEYIDNDGHFSPIVDFSYKADDSSICLPVSENCADEMYELLERLEVAGNGGDNWRSPIYMPREVARLFLTVKNIRVERLKDMTLSDYFSEGFGPSDTGMVQDWQKAWNGIYAKRGYGWDINPWVWVIEFKRQK